MKDVKKFEDRFIQQQVEKWTHIKEALISKKFAPWLENNGTREQKTAFSKLFQFYTNTALPASIGLPEEKLCNPEEVFENLHTFNAGIKQLIDTPEEYSQALIYFNAGSSSRMSIPVPFEQVSFPIQIFAKDALTRAVNTLLPAIAAYHQQCDLELMSQETPRRQKSSDGLYEKRTASPLHQTTTLRSHSTIAIPQEDTTTAQAIPYFSQYNSINISRHTNSLLQIAIARALPNQTPATYRYDTNVAAENWIRVLDITREFTTDTTGLSSKGTGKQGYTISTPQQHVDTSQLTRDQNKFVAAVRKATVCNTQNGTYSINARFLENELRYSISGSESYRLLGEYRETVNLDSLLPHEQQNRIDVLQVVFNPEHLSPVVFTGHLHPDVDLRGKNLKGVDISQVKFLKNRYDAHTQFAKPLSIEAKRNLTLCFDLNGHDSAEAQQAILVSLSKKWSKFRQDFSYTLTGTLHPDVSLEGLDLSYINMAHVYFNNNPINQNTKLEDANLGQHNGSLRYTINIGTLSTEEQQACIDNLSRPDRLSQRKRSPLVQVELIGILNPGVDLRGKDLSHVDISNLTFCNNYINEKTTLENVDNITFNGAFCAVMTVNLNNLSATQQQQYIDQLHVHPSPAYQRIQLVGELKFGVDLRSKNLSGTDLRRVIFFHNKVDRDTNFCNAVIENAAQLTALDGTRHLRAENLDGLQTIEGTAIGLEAIHEEKVKKVSDEILGGVRKEWRKHIYEQRRDHQNNSLELD